MKKNSSPWNTIAACALFAVIVSVIVSSFLIIPAAAMLDTNLWAKTIDEIRATNVNNDRLLLPEPPYVSDDPTNKGTYTGPCPIGTGRAPQLGQTGLSTGALCRGACGMDCPQERCTPIADETIVVDGGVCTYTNVVMCDSHAGCRNHDACYDYCSEKAGDSSVLFGHCHGLCNQRCYDEYGYGTCAKWADLPGAVSSRLGGFLDSLTAPPADKFLVFSDQPVFTPDSMKATVPVIGAENTAYRWAILDSMQNSPDCSSWTYYADGRCNGAGWDGTCGQVLSQCVDRSGYKNGLRSEFTYHVVSQTDGNGNTYTSPQPDGWSITYDYAGNIVTAFRWDGGVQSDYCYGVGSRDDAPWDGVGGNDRHLECEGADGKSYNRQTVSLSDS